MNNKFISMLLIILALSGTARVYSQSGSSDYNPIQTVVPFLMIAPDSRSGGMGDAGVATSPDCFSQHWNNSKYAFIDGKGGVGISYSPWLRALVPDINLAYISGYKRFDKKQVLSSSLLYSSLGDIPFTDDFGNLERNFTPTEFAFDLGYARLFSEHFSGGVAFRFIYSNLTGNTFSGNLATKPGTSIAADLSGYYKTGFKMGEKDGIFAAGFNFSNIGSKMTYTESKTPDFIPMDLRIGASGTVKLDNYNTITLAVDLNKLLVPTPPIYYNVGDTLPSGQVVASPKTYIRKGKDPNVAVPVAIFQSFVDAPGGLREELHEITESIGAEYWYNNQFALRCGYFNESASKGNRKYFTAGAGFRMHVFSLEISYLMPVTQNNPLAHTLRFSLSFDFNALRNVKRG
ncbi:MAG TPA: type IX secretion system outer membrane channel protein PorV [Bacteroidales bacterium]|nr:type IX secretion system outer membrane channel protein PorV [Bacteroidales bacterium]